MKKSSINSITLSNLYFHQKIMVKYQKYRKNSFRLPVLIFSKNGGRFFPQRINIFNSVESLRNFFSWVMTEKFIPLLKVESKFLKNIQNMYKMFKLLQPEFISRIFQNKPANRPEFSSRNIGYIIQSAYNTPSQVLYMQPIFSLKNTTPYPLTSFNISSQGRAVKETSRENRTALLLNKRISTKSIDGHFTKTYQNWTAADKSFIRKYDYDLVSSTVGSLTGRSTYYKIKNESFIFQNQRMMKEEIEQIKKIVVKTKESLEKSVHTQASVEKDIKSKVNIGTISDQVYRNIERRIRIERERRGV